MKKLLAAAVLVLATALPAQAQTTWSIGFKVTTPVPTNIVVGYRVRCSNGDEVRIVAGRFRGQSPMTKTLQASLSDATSCHLTVVAWDPKPWNGPHGDGQHPQVSTWVAHA